MPAAHPLSLPMECGADGGDVMATTHPHPSGELPEANLPRPGGSFDAAVLTFAAMGLFDGLSGDRRARVPLPQADPGRTHWNFLPVFGLVAATFRDARGYFLTEVTVLASLAGAGRLQSSRAAPRSGAVMSPVPGVPSASA